MRYCLACKKGRLLSKLGHDLLFNTRMENAVAFLCDCFTIVIHRILRSLLHIAVLPTYMGLLRIYVD